MSSAAFIPRVVTAEDEQIARSAADLLEEPLEIAAWKAVADNLRERLAAHTFKIFVAPAQVLSSRHGILRLGYEGKFFVNMVRDYYLATFEEELLAVANRKISVELEALPESQKPQAAPAVQPKAEAKAPQKKVLPEPLGPGEPPASRRLSNGLETRYSFDSYVKGEGSEFAFAACKAVADAPGKAYNPLFLWGGVGLGKTHLLQAIGHQVLSNDPKAQILYVSSERFTNDVVQALQQKRMGELRKRYRECDVLLLDDVHFLASKPATVEEFLHTFNALVSHGKQVVVTSDAPPQAISRLDPKLQSRLMAGLVADIRPPEIETRIAIVRSKAEAMRLRLQDDVLAFLATNVRQNVRELEGCLTRVAAFANLMKSPVSVDLCREVLKGLLVPKTQSADLETIVKRCAEFFGVSVADIRGPVRKKQIARARQAAMFLGRRLTKLSYPELGERFGGKDHSTVINAVKRVPELMAQDEDFRLNVESLERELATTA